MSVNVEDNIRPEYDEVLKNITHYVLSKPIESIDAYETAKLCLMDSLGCAVLALNFPACTKLIGPIVSGATLVAGARVIGTSFELDPVQAAFNNTTLIRWLDFNDTWLAAEWGHPSDNLGAILAIADYISRQGERILTMHDVLTAMIKAHEIQGIMALENSFNRVGLDHVILVKLASAAVVAGLLGADEDQMLRTLSHVFVDGQSLRTYRHAPNTGSRKSWAAGDAAARGVFLALMVAKGEMGYPSALTVPTWGFYDVLFNGKPFKFQRDLNAYVMENVLFKLSYPAEFHAQTAVEAAVKLHPLIKDKLEDINHITLATHESAIRIISKQGALHNPADRDHCLQYMTAIGLLHGNLEAYHYENEVASDIRIDNLREKMRVEENLQFSKDYHDPSKRSIANSLQIFFKDGSCSEKITIEYPIGHKRRREEGIPVLLAKFTRNLQTQFDSKKIDNIFKILEDTDAFAALPVDKFMTLWKK